MPISSLVDYKKPLHRRDNSGELDVFEAAHYYNDNFVLKQKVVKEERQGYLRGRRASLDMMNTLRNHHQNLFDQYDQPIPQPCPQKQEKQQIIDKKHKQPSSPGGKLAHFLNSLFTQNSSKKNKPSSNSSTLSIKDDENSNGRRKRRSSISHFRSTNSAIDVKSMYSSSSSGFRTPPPCNLNTTPNKCFKDFKSFSDHKEALATLSKFGSINNGNGGSSNPKIIEKISENGSQKDCFDEKFKVRNARDLNHKNFKEDFDGGAESDSSSDLFELKIDYGFGFCSNGSGLPVYETTHMDGIKRSSVTAITNGPIKN